MHLIKAYKYVSVVFWQSTVCKANLLENAWGLFPISSGGKVVNVIRPTKTGKILKEFPEGN